MKAMQKTLNWEAVRAPININKKKLANRSAIIRSDSGELLGLRSNQYRLFTNKDFKELVNRVVLKTGYNLVGYQEFRKGKRVIAYLKLSDACLPNGASPLKICGNETADYMLIGNSHDGSSALFISFTNVLLRCENQFTTPLRLLNMRHLANISFDDYLLDKVIRNYHNERDQLYGMMVQWTEISLTKSSVDRLIIDLVPAKHASSDCPEVDRKRRGLRSSINREITELGFNYWGLFNGVTHYTTGRTASSLFGNPYSEGNKLNKKAMNFIKNEIDSL
ncbi:MAG: DUF932 domain-containing protein [Crocinitomicaceae bacterium]|jgi:hypothetical protein|nr:DUF932 domain-containing protein [Crocinitomicaceae bacterium]MBT6513300.1 DUF932 domain-containing protein [Crocinitomicaceae bacterium]